LDLEFISRSQAGLTEYAQRNGDLALGGDSGVSTPALRLGLRGHE